MNTIKFQNVEYKIREIDVPQIGAVLISTHILNNLLTDEFGAYVSKEARFIDEQIFYFVDDSEIELNEKLLTNLLPLQ